AAASGALASTLWSPRRAYAAGLGAVKRLILIPCLGGVRWNCTFDGSGGADNPWGIVAPGDWASAVGNPPSPAPDWGLGRLLMQRPVNYYTTDWATAAAHLQANDFNLTRPQLTSWGGDALPTFADMANEVAIARVNNVPGGGNLDHYAASEYLFAGAFG